MVNPFWPHGTTVEIGSVPIGGIVGISFSGEDRGAVDVTHGGSAGNKQYLPGFREGGSLNLDLRADPQDLGQKALRANYEAASATAKDENFEVTMPSSRGIITFLGFVTQPPQFDLPQASDDAAMSSAVIKITSIVSVDDTP